MMLGESAGNGASADMSTGGARPGPGIARLLGVNPVKDRRD
jgi:hypothetical protein